MAEFKTLDLDCAAWVADTRHLSRIARGLYMDMLILCWISPGCRLPNDVGELTKLLSCSKRETAVLRAVVEEFWKPKRSLKYLYQKRLCKEWEAAKLRRHNSRGMNKYRWDKEKRASRTPNTDTDTDTEVYSPQTPRKRGAKNKAQNGRRRSNVEQTIERAFRDLESAEQARGSKDRGS